MTSVTIALQTDKKLNEYGPLAAAIEAFGFDGITVYNDMLYQPAWYPLMEIARATSHVRIGPAAVNPFTCHPINIASQIALLDEAANGRTYLGLARGGWLDFVGIQPERPIRALREAFGCVRHLLSQSKEPFDGEIFPVAGGDALRWTIPRADIPMLLGTWGAKTIAACVDQISEIKIGGSANPDVISHFRRYVSKGLARSDGDTSSKSEADIDIAIGAVTVVDEDGDAARALARREVALYLPIVAKLDPSLALDPDLLTNMEALAEQYDFDAIGALISDELLDLFAFAGTPEAITKQALNLFDAGANRIEFGTPHGLSAEKGIALLGERVLPSIRAEVK